MSDTKRLYTFKDLLSIAPLGERALRSRLVEMGYIASGRKMFFTEGQVNQIIEDIAVKHVPIVTKRGPHSFAPGVPTKAPSQRELDRRQRAQQKRVDAMKKPRGRK